MKNIILLTLGVNDFFFHKHNTKLSKEDQKAFVDHIESIVSNEKYLGVVNVTIPVDTNKHVNVFKNRRPQSVSRLNLFSDSNLLNAKNELKLTSLDMEQIALDANQFDFIFPTKDYEIHVCGLDVNGLMVPIVQDLLNVGYTVKLYSGSIKPFKTTYKQISKISNPNFKYCSASSAL